jgi:Xaa-Pro aminopeptidase
MHTMHPTLLIGPSDWDPQQIPRADYDARLAALWRHHPDACGAIVYGDSRNHAALAYLTHFTPKLEAAIALIPRHGEAQMLIGGGINMLPAAKPLTFITNLAPLRSAGKTAADWAHGLGDGTALILIGGDAMPNDLRHSLDQALGQTFHVANGDAWLQTQMQRKAPRELQRLRDASALLDAAADKFRRAVRNGESVTDCIIKAEHAALQQGAQDVRSLFSLDGGRTLRPFDHPLSQHCDPLQAYFAIRHDGYWTEGFVRAASASDPLGRTAESILSAIVTEAKSGVTSRHLHDIADRARGTLRSHPLATDMLGTSIGLILDEPPILRPSAELALEPDAVYSLRAGVTDAAGDGAIVSSIVAVTAQGREILWPRLQAAKMS